MTYYKYFIVFLLTISFNSLKAEYFTITDYKVDIKVLGSEGIFEVTEVVNVLFSEPRHGIFRSIPYRYKMDGKEFDIKVYDIKVSGYKSKVSTENNNYVIRIGDANTYVDGDQTYVISYKVKKAFLFMEDHTEFYWNLVGNQWPVDIYHISYTVKLDEALTMSESDYRIYTGYAGDKRNDATVSYYLDTFKGRSTKKFNIGEGMTLAINLPIDYVKRPTYWEAMWEKYGTSGIGGVLFAIITGLFYNTWRRYGKDYPIVKMVEFAPPSDITPAEAGVIIDEKADNVDILCLLPYWAHNGYIQIKKIPKSRGKDDHELIKLKSLPDGVEPYEKIVFDGLFSHKNSVLVSDLQNTFYEYLQSAKVSLKTRLTSMGVYYPVSIKMQIYTGVVAFLLLLLGLISAFVFQSFVLGFALGLSGAIGFVFANYMLKKNERGVQLYQQILGFKMFVKAAEKDKLEYLLKEDPDYFEKTLPYAMIFGYAKQWSKKFDGLLLEPPKWYVTPNGYYGSGGFMPSEFGTSFDSSIHEIQSAFTSMPESTGGGGGSFSGGGSSGGGFGGGGGGSW